MSGCIFFSYREGEGGGGREGGEGRGGGGGLGGLVSNQFRRSILWINISNWATAHLPLP